MRIIQIIIGFIGFICLNISYFLAISICSNIALQLIIIASCYLISFSTSIWILYNFFNKEK